MKNNDQPENSSFGLGVLVGIAVGVAGTYLTTSEKGKEIKDQLIQEYERAKRELEGTPWKEVSEKLEHTIQEAREKVGVKIEDSKQERQQTIEETKSLLEKLKTKAQEIIQDEPEEPPTSGTGSSRRFFTKSGSQMK